MKRVRPTSGLLGQADLPEQRDLDRAREILRAYAAPSDDQALERDRILAFIDEHSDAACRTCTPGHLTASALLVHASGERALLTLHRKLGLWLQLGGHCDGDANLAGAALREAVEESGIDELLIDPRPIDVDIHTIPARREDPEHLHLDVRFVVWAPAGAQFAVSDESIDLRWVSEDELVELGSDESVRRLFR